MWMKVFHSLASIDVQDDSCLTMGVFDGIHLGHQRLLRRVVDIARARGIVPFVLTFDPHPEAVVSPQGGPPLLTTVEEKLALFREFGIKAVAVLPFDKGLAQTSARDFANRILIGKLHVAHMVVGIEATFGKGAHGTTSMLVNLGDELGFKVEVLEQVVLDNLVVSSTAIRTAILAGELEKAARMLGRPYRLTGTVISGAGRGKGLGFPTANIKPPADKALPLDGVYACAVFIDSDPANLKMDIDGDAEEHAAVVYIGTRPTFGGGERLIEAHLWEQSLELTGKNIGIYFISRLRGDITFAHKEELVQQMAFDAQQAFELLSQYYSSR